MAFQFEIDEEVPITLPPIVDDDGDPVAVDHLEFIVSADAPAELIPGQVGGEDGVLRATGIVGQGTATIRVFTAEGGFGDYTGEFAIGLGVPVGGALAFGQPRKKQA